MSQFTDAKSRSWSLDLDAPLIAKVRSTFGQLDLAALDGAAYIRLADDPVLLVDVLWFLCREQAAAAGIDEADFGRSLVGDAIQFATDALLEAITEFFPTRRRPILRAAVERDRTVRDQAMTLAIARINDPAAMAAALATVEAALDALMPKSSITSSSVTNTPASAASDHTA